MGFTSTVASKKHWGVQTIKLRAAAARSKGDIIRISTGHADGALADVAIADDTNVYRVAVVMQSAASGDVYEAAIRGMVKATVPSGDYTAGNGLHILNGAVADSGAAAEAFTGVSTANDFAVIVEGGTSVTEVTVNLYGDPITAQT